MECLGCGNSFERQRSTQKYCCYKCGHILRRKRASESFNEFKKNLGCSRCGYKKYGGAIAFHHPPWTKTRNKLLNANNFSGEEGREEIEKCILVCLNCHAIIHHEERLRKG